MARIFYSMAGEGRGHATRARALTDRLRSSHDVVLFAPGHAYRFLAPLYANTDVRVVEIPGLFFGYDANGRVAFGRTAAMAARYLAGLSGLVADLVLTDFEGALPRAAQRCGIPFLSVDHEHFLRVSDLSELPWRARWHALYMGWMVGALCSGQQQSIVSSFYFPPLKPRFAADRRVMQVGVFLRDSVRNARRETGEHLCVYLRRAVPENVLRALEATGRPAHVFTDVAVPRRGRIRFEPISEARFVECLATCRALVSTAGNQLVGEAQWLGKPVFAMPEANNHEQRINAHFLAASGCGIWRDLANVEPQDVSRFLDELETVLDLWRLLRRAAAGAARRCRSGPEAPPVAGSSGQALLRAWDPQSPARGGWPTQSAVRGAALPLAPLPERRRADVPVQQQDGGQSSGYRVRRALGEREDPAAARVGGCLPGLLGGM